MHLHVLIASGLSSTWGCRWQCQCFSAGLGLRVLCCLKQCRHPAKLPNSLTQPDCMALISDWCQVLNCQTSSLSYLSLFQSSELSRVTPVCTGTAVSRQQQTPNTNSFSLLKAGSRGKSSIPTCAVGMARNVGSHGRPAGQEDFLAISSLCVFPDLLGGTAGVLCVCWGTSYSVLSNRGSQWGRGHKEMYIWQHYPNKDPNKHCTGLKKERELNKICKILMP